MSEVHLTINGQPVTARKGQTILEAATAAGFDIPTLCHHPAVSNHGACRMCLVEVKGMRTLQTACTCPVAENMEVLTDTEEVIKGRKFSLELLFSERNHYCMFCQVSGDCELQELAYRYGLDHWHYRRPFERMILDASDPYIVMEPNRCVLCTRCVRACAEIAANHTLGLRERGSRTMIMADLGTLLGESSCMECGTCIQVCPTGALIDARSAYGGHEETLGHTYTTCTQCSVGCAIDVVTRESRVLRVDGIWEQAPSHGLLCVDGRFKPLYEAPARIMRPHVRRDGALAEVSWDEALGIVARRLQEDSAIGLTSAATTNEALEAFVRLFSAVGGEAGSIGRSVPELGFGEPARLSEVLEADFIVVTGADPLREQRVVGYLVNRAADQGAQVALIGVRHSELSDRATMDALVKDAEVVVEQAALASRPVVVYGAGLSRAVAKALTRLAGHARFLALEPAPNGRGAIAAGLAPLSVDGARTVYLLLGERVEDGALDGQLGGAFTIAQAAWWSPLAERADVVLPAPMWAERTGHVTNLEGDVLSLSAAVPMPADVRDEPDVLAALVEMV
jgi:formate dehydrogenase major subunit